MRLLLDTHAFIWWFGAQDKLSTYVLNLCQDPSNSLFLSIASIWEMQIKLQLGKLSLAKSLRAIIEERLLDIMYDLPSRQDVRRCVITGAVIMGQASPTLYGAEGQPLEDSPPNLGKAA